MATELRQEVTVCGRINAFRRTGGPFVIFTVDGSYGKSETCLRDSFWGWRRLNNLEFETLKQAISEGFAHRVSSGCFINSAV